ncbi:transposase [Micromonospora sp. NPDC050495]|uniref:transposase n=1 Tax=Micromonospora sp. NPDC050495 TaxID=3154936 RepID=UPI0033D856B0
MPEEIEFATKPDLAADMITAAIDAGVPAAWATADEAYGNSAAFRTHPREHGLGYVLAVSCSHLIPLDSGKVKARADQVAAELPVSAWQRRPAGAGSKGPRFYDWACLDDVCTDADPDDGGHHSLLIRRNTTTGELALCRCWTRLSVDLGLCRPARRRVPRVLLPAIGELMVPQGRSPGPTGRQTAQRRQPASDTVRRNGGLASPSLAGLRSVIRGQAAVAVPRGAITPARAAPSRWTSRGGRCPGGCRRGSRRAAPPRGRCRRRTTPRPPAAGRTPAAGPAAETRPGRPAARCPGARRPAVR